MSHSLAAIEAVGVRAHRVLGYSQSKAVSILFFRCLLTFPRTGPFLAELDEALTCSTAFKGALSIYYRPDKAPFQ